MRCDRRQRRPADCGVALRRQRRDNRGPSLTSAAEKQARSIQEITRSRWSAVALPLHAAPRPGKSEGHLRRCAERKTVTKGDQAMRAAALLLALPLLAACSTMGRTTAPSAVASEATDAAQIAGRWQGHWSGAGLFYSDRRDNLSINFVQQGDLGFGRLVLEGTGAAESVPWEVRRAGMWGTQVTAKISDRTVTLRHSVDARVFTAEMQLSED